MICRIPSSSSGVYAGLLGTLLQSQTKPLSQAQQASLSCKMRRKVGKGFYSVPVNQNASN